MWWRKPHFHYPIPPAPRTAVLSTAFRSSDRVHVFDTGRNRWIEAVEAFAPQAVAGTYAQLEVLAGRAQPTHAVIVFRQPNEPRVSDAERDRLWRAFRVATFEQIISPEGVLYAAECEAHEGLHIESARFKPTGAEIDASLCGCGRSGPRLVSRTARALSAAAGNNGRT